jgi:hypothetical protein
LQLSGNVIYDVFKELKFINSPGLVEWVATVIDQLNGEACEIQLRPIPDLHSMRATATADIR